MRRDEGGGLMGRARLLARRGAAQRGLLALVLLLVAAVGAAVGATVASVQDAQTAIAREGLAGEGREAATLVVQTRLRPSESAAQAQDEAVRGTVRDLFAGAPYELRREVVPDTDSDDPFLRWTLAPDVAATGPEDLPVLAAGAQRLQPLLHDDEAVSERGVTVTGDLPERAAAARVAARAASAVTLVPLILLALVGVVAVAQVARLLAATREAEVRLLVARGASAAQVTAAATWEAAVVCALAAGVGVAGAGAWLAARGAPGGAGEAVGGVLGSAGAVAALAAVTLGVAAGLQARAAAAGRPAELSGRGRQAAAVGTVVLTLVAAGVTLWLLLRYGSPLVPTPDGGRTDPAAAAAPALALAAAAVVVVAALGPLSRGWAALASRSRGAVGVLIARQVARRLVVVAVPVALVVLAGGSVVLAATYAGTSERLRGDAAIVANGTDVRVVRADGAPVGADAVARLAGLDGALAAVPAMVVDADIDHRPVATLGLPAGPGTAGDVVRVPDGGTDPAATLSGLAGTSPFAAAPALPPGTEEVTLRVTGALTVGEVSATGPIGRELAWADLAEAARGDEFLAGALALLEGSEVALRVWLADAEGQVVPVEAGTLGYDLDGDGDPGTTDAGVLGPRASTHDLTIPLPPGLAAEGLDEGPRLVGLDVVAAGSESWVAQLDLRVDSLTADTGTGADPVVLDPADSLWAPASDLGPGDPGAAPEQAELGVSLALASRRPSVHRLLTSGAESDRVPVVVSRPLADLLDLEVGERTELPAGPVTLQGEVVRIVESVPGAGEAAAVLVDLDDLQAWFLNRVVSVPLPDQAWVGADAGTREGAGLRDLAAAVADVTQSGGPVVVTTSTVPPGRSDAAAPVRAAFGVAAAGAAVLAVVGVAAAAVASLRTRRPEVAVLRAVGVPPRTQGAGRAAELLAVGLAALVAGLVAGGALAAAVVPGLALETLTGVRVVPPVINAVAWSVVAVAGGLLVAGLGGVAVAIRARVVAQAHDAGYREEVR
ncbi:hypothetical protein GCM10009809_06010 [Isoptericola hypogeus]|uniref:ABC3 transporter permease C-terminal domain-containing protein n=1 Tax=Isoptericola hypogeus TaxID=300179 RepID=A0ABN2IW90_9MICO